ncbi:50S ribosomal protein L19, partial [Patescibacteria group bacterium]|nr:50S ribosomal protein L19 [Patescibacteria group bacterium]
MTEEQNSQEQEKQEEDARPESKPEEKKDAPEQIHEQKESAEEPKEEKIKSKDFSYLKPGMTVKVHQKIQEIGKKGEAKERIQIFEGMIIAIKGKEISKTITVRKISEGIGVEKIFPLHLPTIVKIEPVKQAK